MRHRIGERFDPLMVWPHVSHLERMEIDLTMLKAHIVQQVHREVLLSVSYDVDARALKFYRRFVPPHLVDMMGVSASVKDHEPLVAPKVTLLQSSLVIRVTLVQINELGDTLGHVPFPTF